jgi:DNA-binding MarR family transcriptional regulator
MSDRLISKAYYVKSMALAVDDLAFQLNSVAIHLVHRLRRADASLGVTPARLSALSVLVFGGARSLAELAAAEQVSAPTMSKIAVGLESAGLIQRGPDPHDRRAVRLTATAAGKRLMHRGRQQRVEQLATELRSLPAADINALTRAAAVLRALEGAGPSPA